MTRVETTVTVNRPLDEVFDFISNFENNPLWQSGVQQAKITSEGPLDVGTTYSQLAKFLGRPVKSEFEVIEFESRKLVKGRSTTGSFPITFTRSVEFGQGGTKVTAVIEGDASGFFRLAEPILSRIVQRQVTADYRNLKDHLESQE